MGHIREATLMHWPRLSTPDVPGDIPVLAYEDTKKGKRVWTTAAIVYQALRERKADLKPISIDSDLIPQAKTIALQLNAKTVSG